MLTLDKASKELKLFLKWTGIIVSILIAILLTVKLAVFIKEYFYPTPPPPAEVAYGKLQIQNFPETLANNFTYSINTLTGSLPAIKTQLRVYRMKPFMPDLLAVNKFQNKIAAVGFAQGATAVSDKVFEWVSNQNQIDIEKRIRLNIVNNNFTITSAYMLDANVLTGKKLPNTLKATSIATDLLNNMQIMPSDIDLEKTKTNLFYIQNDSLITATSLSNAQVIEVNFYQKDIDKLPIFYEKPNSSNISILISSSTYQGQVVGASFIYQPISNESSTYPLKTIEKAFEELKNGQAYVASYFGTIDNISINKVFLAYYIGSNAQDFLMPIIVFEGNDGFFAYVPAVTDEWIDK